MNIGVSGLLFWLWFCGLITTLLVVWNLVTVSKYIVELGREGKQPE